MGCEPDFVVMVLSLRLADNLIFTRETSKFNLNIWFISSFYKIKLSGSSSSMKWN